MLLSAFAIRRSVSRLCLLGLLLLSGTRARAIIYYVSPTGNDANSGTSWATAKATISAANALAITSDQIWVVAGQYTLTASINLNSGVALYGGFNGTETSLSQRNYVQNVTILNGNQQVTLVTTPAQADIRTRIDGFTLQNGGSSDINAGGTVTVADNIINEPANVHVSECILLGQQLVSSLDNVSLLNNQINGNSGTGGVDCTSGPYGAYILNGNTVHGCVIGINVSAGTAVANGNTVTDCHVGYQVVVSHLTLTQNAAQDNTGVGFSVTLSSTGVGVIADNVSSTNGGGGFTCSGPLVIKDNLIANNSTATTGGGLSLLGSYGGWTVANNTIVDNAAGGATDGGGIYLASLSSSLTYNIANNLVAFNSSGIDTDGSTIAGLALFTNDVYGSDFNNYDGLQPGPTDISLDPLFVNHIDRNDHLTAVSPCIDAGTDSFVAIGDTDLDGNPRIYGAHVDIGCYEWTPSAYPSLASLAISPTTLCSGESTSGLITLTSAALPTGAIVQLTTSSPSALTVPTSVTVPAGSNAALFTVTAEAITAPQTVVVSATYNGITQSVTVTVEPLIASFTLAFTVVIGSANVTGTITLNAPAPSALTITLQSSDASVTAPASVSVAAGATLAKFTATTTSVSAVRTVTLTATGGVQTLTATLVVDPSATLKSLALGLPAITGGLATAGVVTLTAAAPAGGVVIPITNSAPSVASVPATVTVPAGKRSVAFPIVTRVVSAANSVTLTATLGTVTKTAKLTVSPATIASLTLIPSTVEGSENSIGFVTLSVPATSPVIVTLSGSGVATPDVISIIIPTGAIQGIFNISTTTVTAQTAATIQASVYGVAKKATLTVTP